MTTAHFMVIAHRRASVYAPENTLAAFDLALQMGCRHLDLDVDVSRDGQIVVMHDETVDRTTNGTGPVGSQTLAELRALDAGACFGTQFAGEWIPTYAEVLERYRGRVHLHTELKGRAPHQAQCTADLMRQFGMVEHVTVTSFQDPQLEGKYGRMLRNCPRAGW
jgi:glycerophosphoryl diester phosphodiesterase